MDHTACTCTNYLFDTHRRSFGGCREAIPPFARRTTTRSSVLHPKIGEPFFSVAKIVFFFLLLCLLLLLFRYASSFIVTTSSDIYIYTTHTHTRTFARVMCDT